MATTPGPTSSTKRGEDTAALAIPAPHTADPQPAFAALAADHPGLLTQWRRSFFAASFQNLGAQLTDGEVLRLAAAFYADDTLRAEIVEGNRLEGRPLLDLGIYAVELNDRGFPPPASWDGLPEPLRAIDRALREMPPASLLRNPLFVPTQEHVVAAIANPRGSFAEAVAKNPNLSPDQLEDLAGTAFAIPHSDFAFALATNPSLVPDQKLINIAIANPYSNLAWAVGRNRHLTPSRELVAFAIEFPFSTLAQGVAQNPNLVPTPELVAAAIAHADSNLADVAKHPNLNPAQLELLLDAAVADPYSSLAQGVAQHPNLTPVQVQQLASAAVLTPDSYLAWGLAQNPNLTPLQFEALSALAAANPETAIAMAVARNPNATPPTWLVARALEALNRNGGQEGIELAFAVVDKNFPPPQEVFTAAIRGPNDLIAVSAAENPQLTPSQVEELVEVGCTCPTTNIATAVGRIQRLTPSQFRRLATVALEAPLNKVAQGVAQNPRLFTWGA